MFNLIVCTRVVSRVSSSLFPIDISLSSDPASCTSLCETLIFVLAIYKAQRRGKEALDIFRVKAFILAV